MDVVDGREVPSGINLCLSSVVFSSKVDKSQQNRYSFQISQPPDQFLMFYCFNRVIGMYYYMSMVFSIISGPSLKV